MATNGNIEINMEQGGGDGDGGDFNLNVSISETSKGGLKYEVILGDQKVVTPPRGTSPALTNVKPVISAELIELKINAAAERRQSMEAERLAALALKFRKVEEVAKKKDDGLANFINSTKENLEHKMEATIGNRETRIADLKTKLSNHHVGRLQEVRQNLSEHEEKIKQELEAKLETAEKNREKMIQEKLETLKKHDEHVEMIRNKRNSMCDQKTDAAVVENPNPEK